MSTPVAASHGTRSPFSILVAVLAGLALLLPGCDNPACVFGGDCSNAGGGGGSGSDTLPASFPDDGEWIASGAPRVTGTFPSGTGVSSSAPIVVFFSETIAEETLEGGFVLVQDPDPDLPPGVPVPPPVPLGGVLVAEGRVAILVPPGLVSGSTFRVRVSATSEVRDLTGQELVAPTSGDLTTFTVAETDPLVPRVVATWPPAGATGVGTLTSVVAVFDRALNPLTVNPTSFRVRVGGAPPAFDPPPQILSVPDPFGGVISEPRVFTWRSVDPSGVPQSLGVGQSVELQLSPASGGTIEAVNGEELAPFVAAFTTAPIELPLSAELVSSGPDVPDDAIGLAQLDGTAPYMVLVRLAQPAQLGDTLRVDLFGTDFGTPPGLHALTRTVELGPGVDEVLLEEADLQLVATAAPLAARFDGGAVAFAFQHVRGTVTSPVRLLDTDADQAGIQDPILDIEPPTLEGLGFEGDTLDLRSNLIDLVVTGRANEPIRAAHVEAMLLGGTQDNGVVPPTLGTDASGRFLAAPIALGLIDPAEGAIPIAVTVYDRALNPSVVFTGTYSQIGAVGPGVVAPGGDVEVRVFSASSLAPIQGARVFVHEDDAGIVTPVATGITGSDGRATVASGALGTTILTVEAEGHDIFTFQGVTTALLDVPLRPSPAVPATLAVAVTSPLADLPQLSLQAADSRRPPELGPTVLTQGCFFNPFTQTTECAFLPFPIAARAPGALTVFAVNPSAGNSAAFAQIFLKAFHIEMPLGPLAPADGQQLTVRIESLLDSIGADPEQAAIDVAAHTLVAGADVPGLNTASLSGAPRISVQGLAVGIPGPVIVGLGRTFQVTPESWTVRAAFAGVADGVQDDPDDALGELVTSGALDGDLFLAAELVDTFGNRAGARARFSTTGLLLDPPGVPTVTNATVEDGSASLVFTATVTDRLFDADGQPGLHRVRLVDATGRGWELWAVDAPDAAGGVLTALFPDIAAFGGTGLATTGMLGASASTFAWPTLDTGSALGGFLWTDVPRESQLYATSTILPFSAP